MPVAVTNRPAPDPGPRPKVPAPQARAGEDAAAAANVATAGPVAGADAGAAARAAGVGIVAGAGAVAGAVGGTDAGAVAGTGSSPAEIMVVPRPTTGGVGSAPVPPTGAPAKSESTDRKANDRTRRLRADAEAMRDLLERSFEDLAADLAARGRELDARAADQLRELQHDRSSLAAEVRKTVAAVLPGMVAETVDRAMERVRPPEHTAAEVASADELRRSISARLPAMVAEAVDAALERARLADLEQAAAEEAILEAGGPAVRAGGVPVGEARQRSLEKRIDGLSRRAQEIDDRVTTHLRALDDDRALVSDIARRHDRLAQTVAGTDAAGAYERLAAWVNDVVPGMVAGAVQAAIDSQGSVLSASADRAERARDEAETMGRTTREWSERMMETLFRRDQETDDRAAAHLQALEDQRSALAAVLEDGRDEIAESVVGVLPAMVEEAVRSAMAHYVKERRAPVREMVRQLKADSDELRETLQRSFEKMMEALAVREREVADRAATEVRAITRERGELAELRDRVAASIAETLPGMVADAVSAATDLQRAELEAARRDTELLRAANEATATELRDAMAELLVALADRDEALARQAAAYERALESIRAAAARPVANRTVRPETATEGPPTVLVVDETDGGRVKFGSSPVPRARRVERRMLKIDDSDDGPWSPLDRRHAQLSDLLDREDHKTADDRSG